MADAEERRVGSGTLSRRLSKRFSKKVLEEEQEKEKSPVGPVPSSVSSAGTPTGSPSLRRSGSAGPPAMPQAPEVERQFLVMAKKMKLATTETRTLELKWRMVAEFGAAQRCDWSESVKMVRRMVKRPKPVGVMGLYGMLCDRDAEWLVSFVKEGGVKQLMKAVVRITESTATEEYAMLGDLMRCFKELAAVDEGIEAIGSHLTTAFFLAVDLCEERTQLDLLAILTAVVLKSPPGCANVIRAALERKLLAQQQQQLGTLGRRSRAVTAESALVPQRLNWTGLDRVVNLLLGGSDDLLLATVMAVHAMLMRCGAESRDTIVEALRNADFAPKLDLLIRDSKDLELRALIGVLREKNPEFRTKDVVALAGQLNDSLRFMRQSHAAFGNILEHLQKLDRSDKVWQLLEGFVKSLSLSPLEAGADATTWFNEALLSSVTQDGQTRDNRMEAVQAQLEAAQKRMDACPSCSGSRDQPVNPVVLMRQMRAPRFGEAPDSSDESSEFVDVDLDGVRAGDAAAMPVVTATVVRDTPGSKSEKRKSLTPFRPPPETLPEEAGDALPENERKAIAELLKLSAEKTGQ